MRWILVALTVIAVTFCFGQRPEEMPPPEGKPPLRKTPQGVIVPTAATLITELHLTKDDLLPLIAQILSYFGLQHATGQVLSGEELRGIVSSLDELWMVEYDIHERNFVVSDAIKFHQSLMEAQGWRRIFWNRRSKGDRETLLMVLPPRDGLFLVIARERTRKAPQGIPERKHLRVMVIRTHGVIDVNLALGLLVTFLFRPEQPPPLPVVVGKGVKEGTAVSELTPTGDQKREKKGEAEGEKKEGIKSSED